MLLKNKGIKTILNEKEKYVIRLRFGIPDGRDYSIPEIANIMGISSQYVYKIQKQALEKLRMSGFLANYHTGKDNVF